MDGISPKISLQHNTTAHGATLAGKSAAAQRGQHSSDLKGSCSLLSKSFIDASYCVSRQQCISDRALFKSRGLISGKKLCRDLTLMGQIVPVKSDCVCKCVRLCGGGVICLVGGRGKQNNVFALVESEKQRRAEMRKVSK